MKNLIFPQFESYNDLLTLVNQKKDKLFVNVLKTFPTHKFKFKKFKSTEFTELCLISGSLHFYRTVLSLVSRSPFVFVTESYLKTRKIPLDIGNFNRFKHSSFGGATKFEGLWVTSELRLNPKITKLKRTIADFIDHSIRPNICYPPASTHVVCGADRLHPQKIGIEIMYHSNYTASGFGKRPLSIKELGFIFGLPSRMHPFCSQASFHFTPVQILEGLLLPFLKRKVGVLLSGPKINKVMEVPTPVPINTPVLIPGVNRLLPPLWCNLNDRVVEKAAKADDAEVDKNMWNLRITSLWPVKPSFLDLFRHNLMGRICRKLFLEFRSHLIPTYGQIYHDYMLKRSQSYSVRFPELGGGGDDAFWGNFWDFFGKGRISKIHTIP